MGSEKAKKKKNDNSKSPAIGGGSDGRITSDHRYARMHTDPRFREAPKRETKVPIDSRFFHRIITHKGFLPSSARVDRRGKRRPKPKPKPIHNNPILRHYYQDKEHSNSSNDEGDAKPEQEEEETSDDSESDTYTDSQEEEEEAQEEIDSSFIGSWSEIPTIDKETHRLAVVNQDWSRVMAVNLYQALSSFVPPNGVIKSVAVYPTEFGLQRMKEEDIHAPVGLFDDENEKSDDEDDNEKLRAYEMSRMRYYHAVVECDSIATAECIHREVNGYELCPTIPLDIRFIPDNMEFKHPPRDVATEVPANYEPMSFCSPAFQHSKVRPTWDDPFCVKTLKRKFNDKQLAELELNEFLSSDVSESDDDSIVDNKETDKYRALLTSGNGSDEAAENDDVQDIEVTFIPGLENLNMHIMGKKGKKSETVFDACLRKRREKKKAKKNTVQEATEEADDFFTEEPVVKKRKKTQSKIDKGHVDGVDNASKEVLELLLVDDKGIDTSLKGYNLKFKTGKGKKREYAIDEGKIPDSAYDDPRFVALFSPDYALDPTDPQFKRSVTHARQLAQKQKGEEEKLAVLKSKKDKCELSSLVKSIKVKSKQFQLSSVGRRKDGKS